MSGVPSALLRRGPTIQHELLGRPLLRILSDTAEGQNAHIKFSFKEIRLPRGYVAHVPHTDLFELRKSITVEFRGTPDGHLLAHMFPDGSIKTRDQMHAENNARAAEDTRLTAEERAFPALQQTQTRKAAFDRMLQRIRALREDATMSMMAKEVEKSNAILEYKTLLREQTKARWDAAKGAAA